MLHRLYGIFISLIWAIEVSYTLLVLKYITTSILSIYLHAYILLCYMMFTLASYFSTSVLLFSHVCQYNVYYTILL